MPEKVSTKIKRLERELADEIAYTIELRETIRHQADTIKSLSDYLVHEGIANNNSHAIQISREYTTLKVKPNQQLSFNF